ncbi:Sensor protein KdpD [compost metagenome]
MVDDRRLDPDALLRAIHEKDRASKQAKLRVFLGMSAGVGKTYAMLRAAHQRLQEGQDLVIGVVETHGRPETQALEIGIPHVPRKKINHRGVVFEEMDLDAILQRKPDIVIVDELAHTNVSGSRHEKRYQDVLEILDAGIDVYTAINVQHLESRKDAVEAITGVTIRETVPDSILERATLVELVDIAPTELLRRLQEGKIYLGEKAGTAAQNFFKEDRLTALREISLRMTAEKVDQELQQWAPVRTDSAPWQTNERILVAVSHSPYSEKLIRAARRIAYQLEAPWIAVHVDTGVTLNDVDQAQLVRNMNLARELKAEIITTTEVDFASAIRRLCRLKNVTQLLVGRSTRNRLWDLFAGGSRLDHLVRENRDVDIHVIRQESVDDASKIHRGPRLQWMSSAGLVKYWFTLCFLIGVTGLSVFLEPLIGYRAVGFIFLLSVLTVGIFGSLGSVIFSAILSALIWNFLFIPPKMTLVVGRPDDVILCIVFFVAAMITGFLTNRIRLHERVLREREERTNVLFETLQDISNSQDKQEILEKVTTRVGHLLNADCGVVLAHNGGDLEFDEARSYALRLTDKDRAVALWSYQNQKNAGWSTDTLSQSKALYLPLKGYAEVIGIFVFKPHKKVRKLDLEQENLLFSIVNQLGISIERHLLNRKLAEAQRLEDSEVLHQTLLNSISHEMRTPLTAILGSAAALEDEKTAANPMNVKMVARNLQESGDRLNRIIENLLDMSRLNSGVLSLNLEWHDVSDLIGVVIKKLSGTLAHHQLILNVEEATSLIRMDFRLFEHAISNILLNASMYSPPGTEIRVSLRTLQNHLRLEIEDQGPGISAASKSRIFDKFYRVPGSPPGGTGLGLSIVKSIVDLHGGRILCEDVEPHGARFVIEMPLEEQPQWPKEGEV